MKKQVVLVFTVALLLWGCGGGQKVKFHSYDLSNPTDSVDLYLSDLLENIRIIPLETDSSFLIEPNLMASGGKYITIIGSKEIHQFDAVTGKHIRKLAVSGRGPGEYGYIGWAISDNLDHTLYLSEQAKLHILSFNLETGAYSQSADFKKRGTDLIAIDTTGKLYTYKDSLMFGTLDLATGKLERCLPADKVPPIATDVKLPAYMGAFMGGMSVNTWHDKIYMHALRYNDTLYRYDPQQKTIEPEISLSHNDKFKDVKGVLVTVLYVSDKVAVVKLSNLEFIMEDGKNVGMQAFDAAILLVNREDHSVRPIRATYLSKTTPVKILFPFIRYGGLVMGANLYAKPIAAYTFRNDVEKVLETAELSEKDRKYLRELADGLTEESNPVVIAGEWK